MIKASSLYLVIVISLVIAVLCSSLIVTAFYYRENYQNKFRNDRLQNNLQSGINLLLVSDSAFSAPKSLDLFGDAEDSVIINRTWWGTYDIGASSAFIQHDTLYQTFSMANKIDSLKWGALYIIDEDRPLSVSGKTKLTGNVFISKAGIRTAYVDNKPYEGDPKFVSGHIYNSKRQLLPLTNSRLDQIVHHFNSYHNAHATSFNGNSLYRSFLQETKVIHFNQPDTLRRMRLNGNIVLYSDSTLVIDSSVHLTNIMIFAKSVVFRPGFKGSCQVFVTDSVSAGSRCDFRYPSALAAVNFLTKQNEVPPKVTLGEWCTFNGTILSFQKADGPIKPVVTLGEKTSVTGMVYSQGTLSLKNDVKIQGSVYTNKVLFLTSFSIYENYLINLTINADALSPYYLFSDILPITGKTKKILQWLEHN